MLVCTVCVHEGTTMVLNRADECLQRADACRHSAAQAADDVLRVTYLDLARRWRMMAREGEASACPSSGRLAIFTAIRRRLILLRLNLRDFRTGDSGHIPYLS